MSEKKEGEPRRHQSGPIPISEIVPNVLTNLLARAHERRERERLKNAFRIRVPDIKPEDLIPN